MIAAERAACRGGAPWLRSPMDDGTLAEPAGVVDVRQDRSGSWILHDGADLAFDEVGGCVVRFLADQHVLEGCTELQPAALPRRLVDLFALVRRGLDRLAILDSEAELRATDCLPRLYKCIPVPRRA